MGERSTLRASVEVLCNVRSMRLPPRTISILGFRGLRGSLDMRTSTIAFLTAQAGKEPSPHGWHSGEDDDNSGKGNYDYGDGHGISGGIEATTSASGWGEVRDVSWLYTGEDGSDGRVVVELGVLDWRWLVGVTDTNSKWHREL